MICTRCIKECVVIERVGITRVQIRWTRAKLKVYKEKSLILQGVMNKKNIYCLDGGAMKMKTEKNVGFLDSIEVLVNSS